ncbi:MAG TPA: hypothetical protein VK530_14395, partial [Candidatus Acidoferrum sp.]|nr:hypothetical protein [Candidatus Acidoferrum sp.]
WQKWLAKVRQKLGFRRPRTVESDESLAALLARRDDVRSRQTGPAVQPAPELFKPAREIPMAPSQAAEPSSAAAPADVPSAIPGTPPKAADQPANVTSRLLEAKKRAQRKQ